MPRFPSPLPITLLIAALALSGCTTAEPGAERPDPAASARHTLRMTVSSESSSSRTRPLNSTSA